MAVVTPALAGLLGLLYLLELRKLGADAATLAPALRSSFVKRYAALLPVSGVIGWWLAPTRWCAKSNHTASPTKSCRWA